MHMINTSSNSNDTSFSYPVLVYTICISGDGVSIKENEISFCMLDFYEE